MSYAPFPESQLRSLAREYRLLESFARQTAEKAIWCERADILENAVRCQDELRERCLLAETQLRENGIEPRRVA